MPFFPRLAAILLVVFVAACAPAARNAPKQAAKSASSATPINQPGKPAAGNAPSAQAAKPAPAAGQTGAQPPRPAAPGAPQSPAAPMQPVAAPATTAPPALDSLASGAPTGFGGLAWGAHAASQSGMAQYETSAESATATYLWPQGPKDILGAPIRDAYYEFFKDQFYHVWINFDGQAAYEKALAGLTRAYGPPTQENREKFYHAWQLGEVNIYCAYHRDLNEGDVSFFYQPLYEHMIAARKAAGAKAPARSVKK